MDLFFRKSKPAPAKEAIVKLHETSQFLDKREAHLQLKIESELKVARANASKNKRVALAALKRKKQYEGQLEKLSNTKLTIETQLMAIESAKLNLETMSAMKAGADAMKQIHKNMNIDKVDETMDEIRDQMANVNDISEAISQPIGMASEFDEDELNAELEELENEELTERLKDASAPPVFVPEPEYNRVPAHSSRVPTTVEDEDEDELAELKASMANVM